jgi:hypothetical protein
VFWKQMRTDMDAQRLNEKWKVIPPSKNSEISSFRIDGDCIPDLFVGINPDSRRCLICRLPIEYSPDFQSSVRQNLSLELFAEKRLVVLTLLDDQYYDLFDDLIISIYSKIHDLNDAPIYISEFLRIYYRWSEFFDENQSSGLSVEIIRGIIGEFE